MLTSSELCWRSEAAKNQASPVVFPRMGRSESTASGDVDASVLLCGLAVPAGHRKKERKKEEGFSSRPCSEMQSSCLSAWQLTREEERLCLPSYKPATPRGCYYCPRVSPFQHREKEGFLLHWWPYMYSRDPAKLEVPDKELIRSHKSAVILRKRPLKNLLGRRLHSSLPHSSHVSVKERLPIHLESCCSNRTGISLDAQPHSENFFDVLDDVIAGSASLRDSLSCFVNPAQLTQNDD